MGHCEQFVNQRGCFKGNKYFKPNENENENAAYHNL